MRISHRLILILCSCVLLLSCEKAQKQQVINPTITSCQANGPYPDEHCTPGGLIPNITVKQICTPGYTATARNVPKKIKDKVIAEYGIDSYSSSEYEIDHFIPLELGGSNDLKNLWPEAANPKPGFHEKDQVENYLHHNVCIGKLSLREAQAELAKDWLAIYYQIVAS